MEVLRGMCVGGWEEGRQTDGRSWGLEIWLVRFNPDYHLLARVYLVPSITTKFVEIAVLGFARRLVDSGNKLRAHSLSGRAYLTLSFTSDDDEDDDKLTEASLCQHSTAPPPDLLLVDARRLMTTSSICARAPFLSFRPRSTVTRC